MSTPPNAKYKLIQGLRPRRRLLATSATLSEYQKRNGESAIAASKAWILAKSEALLAALEAD